VTRLTVNLSPAQTEALDWIIRRGDAHYSPNDRYRGMAIGGILVQHVQELRERDERNASIERVLKTLREDAAPDTLRRERDALLDELGTLRGERDALRKALEAERATRRRDRERHARTREHLRGARHALQRLSESRATCRDLALRVEAALLRAAPRRDLGNLEGRLDRALRAAGFAMPRAPDR